MLSVVIMNLIAVPIRDDVSDSAAIADVIDSGGVTFSSNVRSTRT